MPKVYEDIFQRVDANDHGEIPATGVLCQSIDIIPYGKDLVQDPVATFGGTHFNEDLGKDVYVNDSNYVYVRGQNNYPGSETAQINLYYAPASLVLWPQIWRDNALHTSGGVDHIDVTAEQQGEHWVGQTPFRWKPAPLAGAGDHYCLVGRSSTPHNPNPVDDLTTMDDFATFIANNRGFAWRNVSMQATDIPTWNKTTNYRQGDLATSMHFQIECTNIPVGCQVAMSAANDGVVIDLPKTTVTNPNFSVGVTANVPAGWQSDISYSFWANNNRIPAGSDVKLVVFYLVAQTHKLARFALSLRDAAIPTEQTLLAQKLMGTIEPVKAIHMGDDTTRHQLPQLVYSKQH